jgi:hypothetical protein
MSLAQELAQNWKWMNACHGVNEVCGRLEVLNY